MKEIRVLLVDDSPEQRQLVNIRLAELTEPRFLVIEAFRLSEALQKLEQSRMDIVLLDLFLPDARGLEAVSTIRKRFSGLPIVVLTETADEKLAIQALREGAEDYLVKSEATPQVLKRVLLHGMERRRVVEAMASNRERLMQGQKLEALGRLAGGIAHDFNNLLVSIIGYSEILVEDLEGSELKADAEEINRAGHRAAELTKQILAFSRRDQPVFEALSVNQIVEDMRRLLARLLPRRIELEIHLSEELPTVLTDRGQFEQVVINLLVNARDAIEDRGRISILTEFTELSPGDPHLEAVPKAGSYVCIRVSDTGSGLSQTIVDGMSEPTFSGEAKEKGTGLGLSTIYGIVQTAQGGIAVDSADGQGTSIYVYLPCFEESEDSEATPITPVGSHESVLILEDKDSLRELMERILTRAGYRVLTALTAEEAQTHLDSPVDLLLIARTVQGLNGETLASSFLQTNRSLRLLLLISHSGEVGEVLTPFPTISKPFTPKRLLSRVREVLDAPVPSEPVELEPTANYPSAETPAVVSFGLGSEQDAQDHLRQLEDIVSQELQEPVRMIKSYLELLAQNNTEHLDEASQEYLQYAQEGASRLSEMLRGIVLISDLRREKVEGHTADTRRIFQQLQERFAHHQGHLTWVGSFPELPMKFDHLYNFLGELVSNGFKFQNQDEPEVRLLLERSDKGISLTVEDNGVGFPEGDRDRCLDLFGRMHGREEFDGTGLGLAYCKAIAQKYGGELTIENSKTGGRVRFFL